MADALTTLGTAMFDDVLMAKKAVGISWKVKGSLAHSGIFGIFWRLLSGVVRWHNEQKEIRWVLQNGLQLQICDW